MSSTASSTQELKEKEADRMEADRLPANPEPRDTVTAPRRSTTEPRRSLQFSPSGRRRSSGAPFSPSRRRSSGTPFSPTRRRSSNAIPYGEGERSIPMGPPRTSIAINGEDRPHPSAGEGPPSLEYNLDGRKRRFALFYFWTFVVIDSVFMPIGLYFGLWYGTNLSPNTVFSIVTAALGGISIFEYFIRFWRLFKKGSTCRVIGGRRAYLDWFHWCFTTMWVIIMVELIIGTIPENPPIRLIAMPLATLLWTFGTELLITDVMRLLRIPSPFRMSSIPKGAVLRPGIYTFIEDVVAVDGSGGTAFRERLNARYEASHYFRQMLHRLTLFWGFGAEGMAILTTALVFTLPKDAAYAVGWSAPFIWAGIWALCTWWYVRKDLRMERERWGMEDEAEKV